MIQKIVQIVPRLPPYTDGEGDYSLMLAEQLLEQHNLKTHFLVCRPDVYSETTIKGFPITVLPSLTTEAFLSVFPPMLKILFYNTAITLIFKEN